MNQETVTLLLDPVVRWLRDGGDPWEANLEYWSVRRRLMDNGHSFEGIGAETVSSIDTAMDVFSPDDGRHAGQIGEDQLRVELAQAINALREVGLLPDT